MPVIEERCTISVKGQTTIPRSVRRALGVGQGDRIAFRIQGNVVTVEAVEDGHDPALGAFLDLIARDMATNPGSLRPLTEATHARLRSLTQGVNADPDQEIEGEVSL